MNGAMAETEWMKSLMGHLTLLTDQPPEPETAALFGNLSAAIEEIPNDLPLPEQVMVRGLLTQVLWRAASLARINNRAEAAEKLLAFAASTSPAWRLEWSSVVECCAAEVDGTAKRSARTVMDWRVRCVLEMIEREYGDPQLSLRHVATAVNLSPWYIARMLKRHTGTGFAEHLRRRRLAVAQRLLTDSVLSVKEIAAAVGYHPTRLSHNFRASCGVTPVAFRMANKAERTALEPLMSNHVASLDPRGVHALAIGHPVRISASSTLRHS
jgi:AraC-like DNA-binding protein